MSKERSTPGPWHTWGQKVVDADDFTVAKCGYISQSDEEACANAALCAAAPDMYEMLEHILLYNEVGFLHDDIKALLAKARRENKDE